MSPGWYVVMWGLAWDSAVAEWERYKVLGRAAVREERDHKHVAE